MIVKEVEYYTGNTAANPKRKYDEQDRKKYEDLKRSKRNRNKRIKEDKKSRRSAALQVAILIFIVGTIIIARDNKVYLMQQDLSNINKQVRIVNDENEALKVDLLKGASLAKIRTNAETKLGMQTATKDSIVKLDLSNNYFAELDNDTETKNTNSEGLLSKIKDALN